MIEETEISEGPTETHVFIAVESDEVYESARAWLDAEWGHPKGKTTTCIPPAAQARHDAEGRPLVALLNEQAAWSEVAPLIEYYVAQGLAVEITRADYLAAMPSVDES